MGSQMWHWKAVGWYLKVDTLGLGQQLMMLPYAIDDSRREQRLHHTVGISNVVRCWRWASSSQSRIAVVYQRGELNLPTVKYPSPGAYFGGTVNLGMGLSLPRENLALFRVTARSFNNRHRHSCSRVYAQSC
jgi:hypothetical protein